MNETPPFRLDEVLFRCRPLLSRSRPNKVFNKKGAWSSPLFPSTIPAFEVVRHFKLVPGAVTPCVCVCVCMCFLLYRFPLCASVCVCMYLCVCERESVCVCAHECGWVGVYMSGCTCALVCSCAYTSLCYLSFSLSMLTLSERDIPLGVATSSFILFSLLFSRNSRSLSESVVLLLVVLGDECSLALLFFSFCRLTRFLSRDDPYTGWASQELLGTRGADSWRQLQSSAIRTETADSLKRVPL